MKDHAIYILLAAYAMAGLLTIIFFNGTGDNGDSIYHYLFSKYAPLHPKLFLNHWAKPLFVLISSPFAQFGFEGMKIFNLSVVLFTLYLTYKTSVSLKIQNSLLSVVILIFTPLYYILTFSGLTEPLFAFFLIAAIYLTIHQKYLATALLVSFMPFIRSEGLIIILVFGLFFLLKKQWKFIPLLATGHVVYSLAGYFTYHDLFWVFNKMPYASLAPKHGHGPLLHFVSQLNYVIGIPVYLLFCAGIISYIFHWVQKKDHRTMEEYILIGFCFFTYFIAHTLFWYLGIFNSMGLKRVMLGVVPLIAIIALQGFNFLTIDLSRGNKKVRQIFGVILISYVMIFPFTKNPAAIVWKNDMFLTNEQKTAKGIAGYIKEHPVPVKNRLFYTYPYLSEVMNIDHFDSLRRLDLTPWNLDSLKGGDLVIWDNWFAIVESYTKLDTLINRKGLSREIDFTAWEGDREVKFVLFRQQ